MDCFEGGADGFFTLFADAERTVMENAAFPAFGFDDSVARRAGGRGINAEHTNPWILGIHRHSVYGQAFARAKFIVSVSLGAAFMARVSICHDVARPKYC